jgi:hypothetical protein
MPSDVEYIRDFDTRMIIGMLETRGGGDIYAIEFSSRKILGIYRKATDDTIDFETRQIKTKGNSVVSFIYAAWAKNPQNPKNKR